MEFGFEVEVVNRVGRSVLQQMKCELVAAVIAEEGRSRWIGEWRRQFEFREASFCGLETMGSAKNLFGDRLGRFRLCIFFNGTLLSQERFLVTSFTSRHVAACRIVKKRSIVSASQFETIDHRGRRVPLSIVAEDFRAIEFLTTINAVQGDPLILYQANFDLCLNRAHRGYRLSRLPLSELDMDRGSGSLRIEIYVAEVNKEGLSIPIETSIRITDFEGALRFDPHQLDSVDREYEDILNRL